MFSNGSFILENTIATRIIPRMSKVVTPIPIYLIKSVVGFSWIGAVVVMVVGEDIVGLAGVVGLADVVNTSDVDMEVDEVFPSGIYGVEVAYIVGFVAGIISWSFGK